MRRGRDCIETGIPRMNPPFKTPLTALSWLGVGAVAVFILFLGVQMNQTLSTAATTNTVTFSGQGKVLAKPDVAIVELSIVTEALTSKAAQDDNSKKSKAVVDFLKRQNIEESDIKTTGYNIYPQYRYPNNGKPEISGYQVSQTLQVKVRDLQKTDDVLAGIVSAGANQVNQLQLTIDDPDKLREQAREEAIKEAREKAAKLKEQLGIELGRVVNFSEDSAGAPIPMMYKDVAMGRGMGGGGSAIPEVPVGENEIVVNVSLTFQIK